MEYKNSILHVAVFLIWVQNPLPYPGVNPTPPQYNILPQPARPHDGQQDGAAGRRVEPGQRGTGRGWSYLEGVALDDHRDVAVEALQPLLVQTLEDVVAEVGDRHL